MINTDSPNMTKSRIPHTGTIIQVPKADEQQLTHAMCRGLEDGTINVSQVTDQRVQKLFMRYVVEREMHQQAPRNGQRVGRIAVPMTGVIATIGQNIDSVKHPQKIFMMLTGVETTVQFNEGHNALLRVLGADALRNFHRVLESTHQFAINWNQNGARATHEAALATNAGLLRDTLAAMLGNPPAIQQQLNQLQADLTTATNTVPPAIQQQLNQLQADLATANNTIQMANNIVPPAIHQQLNQLQADLATANNTIQTQEATIQAHTTTITQLQNEAQHQQERAQILCENNDALRNLLPRNAIGADDNGDDSDNDGSNEDADGEHDNNHAKLISPSGENRAGNASGKRPSSNTIARNLHINKRTTRAQSDQV